VAGGPGGGRDLPWSPAEVEARLDATRRRFPEHPEESLAVVIAACEWADGNDAATVIARARAIEGHIHLHRGDTRRAMDRALEAERLLSGGEQHGTTAACELAALQAQVAFFTGAYAQALASAERAVELADATGEQPLRLFARSARVMVLGNIAPERVDGQLEEMLELALAHGDLWEQALAYNDVAAHHESNGRLAEARQAIKRALVLAQQTDPNAFALAVVHSTRADIELRSGDPAQALLEAGRSLALLTPADQPNPYVLGASVRAEVLARMQLGEYEDARQAGESALAVLGERMPHTRSMILAAVASALREAGRPEQAYDMLLRSAELEREAFAEITELQLSLERALAQARRAHSESYALAQRNRELARAHLELERRAGQLERLQGQLLDQADRDWLTGVHNRRFLARQLEQQAQAGAETLLSVAVVDLDHFKEVNDRYGHSVGDRVLVRAADLLRGVLRASDSVVRSGGEEFLVLMPLTEADAALRCAERIRVAIASEPWPQIGVELRLTASVGVATAAGARDLEQLIGLADTRMYAAKHRGRDCVVAG
jgi:diguanylate cyclase (GGDEF)-like protein